MAWVMATSVTVHRFLNGDMVSEKKLDYQLIAGTNYVCLVLELLCDHAGLQPVFLWSGWLGGGRERVHLSSQVRRATHQLHQRKIMNHEKTIFCNTILFS